MLTLCNFFEDSCLKFINTHINLKLTVTLWCMHRINELNGGICRGAYVNLKPLNTYKIWKNSCCHFKIFYHILLWMYISWNIQLFNHKFIIVVHYSLCNFLNGWLFLSCRFFKVPKLTVILQPLLNKKKQRKDTQTDCFEHKFESSLCVMHFMIYVLFS